MGAAGASYYLQSPAPVQSEPQTLRLFTWQDYLAPDVVKAFEEKYHARIEMTRFENDTERDTRLSGAAAPDFDLVLAGHRSVVDYQVRGLLSPLDTAKVPNLKHISARWMDFLPAVRGYVAPYFWGSSGIAYRKDLVKEPVTSWMQLLQPSPGQQGHILVSRDPRELVSIALIALGYPLNTLEAEAYQKAEELLIARCHQQNTLALPIRRKIQQIGAALAPASL